MIDNKVKEIINILNNNNYTISTMESCTGGMLASTITNVDGSSDIFKYGAITYSNEYKIKMGVSEDIINKYSVYSIEVAIEMSKSICKYTNSNYGIGITGKLNRVDKYNLYGNDNIVYVSIYDNNLDKIYTMSIEVILDNREKNKKYVIDKIITLFLNIIK